jgi:hypothetical protein
LDCDQALDLDPNYAKVYVRRANCNRALGGKDRLERAVADLDKVRFF